jgi:hypothetical protein
LDLKEGRLTTLKPTGNMSLAQRKRGKTYTQTEENKTKNFPLEISLETKIPKHRKSNIQKDN